jgi:hypothetical protein
MNTECSQMHACAHNITHDTTQRMLTNARACTQHHTTQHKEIPTDKLGMLGTNDLVAENMLILLLDYPS